MSITFKAVEHIYSPDTPFAFHALKGIDLVIPKGSMVALIGHTGSGKSTLIQHINALLLPSAGSVQVEDFLISVNEQPAKLKPLRAKAGLVFQFPEYQIFEETIAKDIMFGPMNFGVSEDDARKIARKVLIQVGLDESYMEKSPFDLSGGQKRRVAIAGILAMNPDILVLDEPTAGLDPQGASDMMRLFKSINKQGKTVIIVSHDMNQVLEYCEDVIVMNQGKVERYEKVEKLFEEVAYLESLSINLPTITSFIHELNESGFDIDPSIKDIETLSKVIGGVLNE